MSIDLEIFVEVRCDECGTTLEGYYASSKNIIYIENCKECLEKAREEGRNE